MSHLPLKTQLDLVASGELDPARLEVADAREAHQVGPDYVLALTKVVASHVINELVGAKTFDEPAIARADSPHDKYLTCRIAMEEYRHHLDFLRLGKALKVDPERFDPARALSIFTLTADDWTEFLAVKALTDFTEIIQLEDLLACSYAPMRRVAERGMAEESFHVGFGWSSLRKALAQDPRSADRVHAALGKVFAGSLPLFGRSDSANNDRYRRWGIKLRSNRDMRGDYIVRVQQLVERLGLDPLPLPSEYDDDLTGFLADGRQAKEARARQTTAGLLDEATP